MGEEKYRSHLNSLLEMILDEEKLVTYVSSSKEFCIHVNDSKSLMIEAVDVIRKKHPDTILNINYIVSGLTDDSKARTLVCSESDSREGFKVIFSDHIYSINKGKPSVDKVAFMAMTTFEDYQLCSGLVKSNDCIRLSSDEIGKLKLKSQVPVADSKITKPPPKKVKEETVQEKNINGHGDIKKVPEVKTETTVKQEKTSPQKDHLSDNKRKTTYKPQKGIAGFFSRSDSASAKKTLKLTKNNDPENKIQKESEDTMVEVEQMDVDEDIVANDPIKTKTANDEKAIVNNGTNKKEKATVNNKSKSNNKSLTQIKKNAKVDKKRKRVLHISDSESDEEKNDPFLEEDNLNKQIDMESEDEIPPTPAANTIKVASNMLNPRKRRKIVNKTYTDEGGYILTRKEEVYESLSENEDSTDVKENIEKPEIKNKVESPKENAGPIKSEVSPNKKKSGPKANKKKISPPQKGKQATLMSFFKKA